VALVRGRVLVPLRAFVKENFGDVGWRRLLGELPPADRQVLDGLLVEGNWYERHLHTSALEVIERLWRADLPDIGRRIGQRTARHSDRFYLRPLMRLGGVMMLVRRASSLYREYFQGGSMSVIEQRDHGARISLDDANAPRLACQETIPGFIEELVRLAGREPVHVSAPCCRYQGGDHCEIDFEWK
jgi:hypothetical protein